MLFTEFQVNTLKIIHSLYQPHHHHHQHSNNSSNNNNHSNTTTNNNNNTTNSNHSDNNSHGIIISTSIHTNDPIQLNQFYDLLYKLIIFIKVILYTLIIISALFGNALVFIAYIKYKQLRSIHTNLFLVSLSIADFIVALLVMPLNAIMSLLNYKWIFGKLLCHIYNATDVLFTTSSILHLCCISMDRYIAIIYPLNYEKRMSKKYIIILLCIIWTLSFMISYIPILLGLHKPLYNLMDRSQIQINISSISRMKQKLDHHEVDDDHHDTDLFLCNFNVNPYYAIISSSISFWIPSIIMILVYLRIFIEAKKQEKKIIQLYTPYNITQINNTMIMQQINKDQNNQTNAILIHDPTINRSSSRSSSSSPSSSCSSPSTSSSLSSKLHHINKQYYSNIKIQHENKAARTLGIVMGAFLLCWLPFFLWYTITNLCKQCQYPNELQEILYWIGYFNSSINPIIYAYYNRIFRQAFIKIIELHKGNIINNEPQQQSINDHNDKLPITRRYKYNTVNQLITKSVKRGGENHDN